MTALNQYEKQANKLNTAITSYIKNPTTPANIKITNFQNKTNQLQKKITIKETILKKIKPVHPIKPTHPIHPVTPVTTHTTTTTTG